MRLWALAQFRLNVRFDGGYYELFPGRKIRMISEHAFIHVEPGDLVDDIYELVILANDFAEPPPEHPLLVEKGDGTYRLDIQALRENYECPVAIPGFAAIEK